VSFETEAQNVEDDWNSVTEIQLKAADKVCRWTEDHQNKEARKERKSVALAKLLK